ncbi:TraB/GumN family protein [Cecembia lonarensis]|uniref:TraB family protein n=1 Tax=Cecembia lonarensis (strain CCUG 58316 / KCTC 22772 / LW9) TaxID=1225176 RepID=K1M2E8_CECL9|nr:TraB/GumN family protein [Cecembia lonarensis]EKB50469.1 TraB family protein [Cecembia lonarensis LW9]
MKKNHLLFAMLLLFNLSFSIGCWGQISDGRSLLWKISGDKLPADSYLFGTIHIICQDQFKMDERILKAFESSEKIALELNLSDQNELMAMQKLSMNENFSNIQDEFEEEDREAIDAFLTEHYGIGLQQFGIFKPFALSSLILVKLLPCEEVGSYELFFVEKAKEKSIPMMGLESGDFQAGLFDQIPLQQQLVDLGRMVTDPESLKEFEELVKAYLDEDIDRLYALITEADLFVEYGDLLLVERNKNWIPIIESLIMEQSTFIAVGSGHLASEVGIIQLLRNAGYSVEPIK